MSTATGYRSLRGLAAAGSCALALLAATSFAQQQSDDSAPNPGPDTTLTPRPAQIATRAASALLLDITAVDGGIVAVGPHGIVLRSTDARHWTQVPTPVSTTLTRVRFRDPRHGYVTGYDGSLLKSDDAGQSWHLLQYDAAWGRPWFDVLFLDPEHGFLCGANGTLKRSSDGGHSWEAVSSDALQNAGNLYALLRLDNGLLMLVGERGFLARSSDQGASWTRLRSPYAGSFFGAVPAGASGLLAFGMRGNTFFATDAGSLPAATAQDLAAADADNAALFTTVAGWVSLANADRESLFGGLRGSDGQILLFGMNGRIWRADTAASRLQRLSEPTGMNINAGLRTADALIVVGTLGIQRLPSP